MKKIIYFLALTLILSNCHSSTDKFSDESSDGMLGLLDMEGNGGSEMIAEEIAIVNTQSDKQSPSPETIKPDKIIKTADIKFEVTDYKKSKQKIDSIISLHGGYISDENERSTNYQIINNIVIRVSNKDFEKLINTIGETSSRIDYKRINSVDVSEEYVDIAARLKTKKEVEKRYQILLQKATKIEDILKIENEIRVIQEEIEAKEGRLRFLDSKVSFSTINLEIYENLEYKYKPKKEASFFARLYKAIDKGWKGMLSFIIGLLHVWPLIIIVIIGLTFFLKNKKKKNRN